MLAPESASYMNVYVTLDMKLLCTVHSACAYGAM